MNIRQATLQDIETLTLLFDDYIVFYRKPSDLASCTTYLTERLERNEAIIFLATNDHNTAMGFTLLYPCFSSVSKARIYILNDLFVHHDHRQKGVGAALLAKASEYGRQMGAIRLHLETEQSNQKAQALYEKEGWEKELDEFHYSYTL